MTLKEIPKEKIKTGELGHYLVNESKETAIKIPANVYKTITTKIRNHNEFPHISLLMANTISVAIQFKATGIFSSRAFYKYLDHVLGNPAFGGFLSDKEVGDLMDFFSDVPSGYSFNQDNRVRAHSEVGDMITF